MTDFRAKMIASGWDFRAVGVIMDWISEAVAEEREACAKVSEALGHQVRRHGNPGLEAVERAAEDIAEVIRARGKA